MGQGQGLVKNKQQSRDVSPGDVADTHTHCSAAL